MPSRKKRRSEPAGGWWRSARPTGLLLLALGLYAALSLTGGVPDWRGIAHGGPFPDVFRPEHPGGPVGSLLAFLLRSLLGALWCWSVPVWLVWRGLSLVARGEAPLLPAASRWLPLGLASITWLGQAGWPLAEAPAARWGGAVGVFVAAGCRALFGGWGAGILLTFLLLTAVLHFLRPWFPDLVERLADTGAGSVGRPLRRVATAPFRLLAGIWDVWRGAAGAVFRRRVPRDDRRPDAGRRPAPAARQAAPTVAQPAPRTVHVPTVEVETVAVEPPDDVPPSAPRTPRRAAVAAVGGGGEDFPEVVSGLVDPAASLPLPDVGLLHEIRDDRMQVTTESLHAAADLLEETLRSFGVEGAVKDVRPGPVVTTYEFQPAAGIKVNAIVQRGDDLALAMKARSIRMEAPIPGKAAVGIEIPNPTQRIVSLREVYDLAQDHMRGPLSVVLGRDVFGEAVTIDLAAQPHLLVAGSTGSGKSVCINAMIVSLLLRLEPSLVRLLLIDPKMLELNVYNDIPHLLLPVITDPKDALRALKWMEAQMDHRYRRLSEHGVRNIEGYNRKVRAGEITGDDGEVVREAMPYYVCIVDELADLMVQLGQEIELPITRIAQKARAVGIHLVLATQRPSVDVLTGVIKANVPCRIAFRVIQKNDSRTILDANGAEKLLGKGDMLYLQPGRATPVRVHGAYVDIEECEAVAAHWRQFSGVTRPITLEEDREERTELDLDDDPLFERAREIIVLSQHGSTSMLQRKLQVGYARAGRLMDLLEQACVVGPFIGSKGREVLMKPEDLVALQESERDDLP